MSQEIRRFTRTLRATGMAFALVVGMSFAANADTHWVDNYSGTQNSKFKVASCGQDTGSTDMRVTLNGPSDLHEYGTWGISLGSGMDSDRFAGTINDASRNKLYANFYTGIAASTGADPVIHPGSSRANFDKQLDELKGDVCGITPLPDDVEITQFVFLTNKKGTRVKTNLTAKYGAIVNEGGRLKQAQFRLNGTTDVTEVPNVTGNWLLRSIQVDEDTPLECPGSITVDGFVLECDADEVLMLKGNGTYESSISAIPTGEGAYGAVAVGDSDVIVFEDTDDEVDPQAYRYLITEDHGSAWLEVYKTVYGYNVKMVFEAI